MRIKRGRPMLLVIKNARKGSFAWWHEKRHAWQEEAHGLMSFYCGADELLKFAAVLLVVFQSWWLVSLCVILNFGLNSFLEMDADWFALRKTGDWRAWLRLKELN